VSATARHLTPAQLADRLQVKETTLAQWRKDGAGPAYLLITPSATRPTIRYRLVDVEEWELSRLVRPNLGQPPTS
jgi:transcriptional regulator with XRE-family HTH domain